jgi:hypothetical protein
VTPQLDPGGAAGTRPPEIPRDRPVTP